MFLSTSFHRLSVGVVLLSLGTLSACSEKPDEPAPLPGRWNLVTQHSINTDVTTGQVVAEQHLAGTAADYLVISITSFDEYRDNQLHFTAPYTYAGSTISMQSTNPRTDLSREVRELTSNKLVLHYKLPVIVNNQQVTIDATYSR
ncbi:hypothetical protein [Hymenobacter pini]|uniref:hypothetical protein n=1 Tax=Hymenobacter pini TaxID=2880879 RepID=UPI001CF5EBC7|nr:hypothetical protein [Hymenobacter pini]MCA8830447.1 hypothetical protein [Hymenobacter pini]